MWILSSFEDEEVKSIEQLREEANQNKVGFFSRIKRGATENLRDSDEKWAAWFKAFNESFIKDTKWKWLEWFKRWVINTWLLWANTWFSLLQKSVWTPIAWAIDGFFWDDGVWVPKEENKVLASIWKATDKAWKLFWEWVSRWLGRELTETEKSVTGYVGWEWALEATAFWAFKSAWKIGKIWWAAASWAFKRMPNIVINKSDFVKEWNDLIKSLEKQNKVFDTHIATDLNKTTEKFKDIIQKVDSWKISVRDVKAEAKKLWVDGDIFVKKLEEISNNNFYRSKASTEAVSRFSKWLKEKTFKKFESKLKEAWYKKGWTKLKNLEAIQKLKSTWVSQSIIDKVTNTIDTIWEWLSQEAKALNDILEVQYLKADDASFKDTLSNAPKWEWLKFALDLWVVERKVWGWRNSSLDSFKLTDKWVETLWKEIDLSKFNSPWKQVDINNFIANWFAEYKTKDFDIISERIDSGKLITPNEINEVINDIASGDKDFNIIDTQLYRASQIWELDWDLLIESLENIDTKYNLKLADKIEKIKNWDNEILSDVKSQLDELKANEFITVDRIKNPWKTINLSSSIGLTNKVFWNLEKAINKIPNDEFAKRKNLIKQKIDKSRKTIKRKYEKDQITLKAKLRNLNEQKRAKTLELTSKYKWIREIKIEIIDNLKAIWKDGRFKGNQSKLISKILSKKQFQRVRTPSELKRLMNSIEKEIEAEHARWIVREIRKELKGSKITKSNKWYKSGKYTIEQAIQLQQAQMAFWKIWVKSLDVSDLEELLDEIKRVRLEWKNNKIEIDKKETKRINDSINSILPDIKFLKGIGNISETLDDGTTINVTTLDKLKSVWWDYVWMTLFSNRLVDEIFWKNKEAVKVFIDEPSKAFNALESFEINFTEKVAKQIGNMFWNDIDRLEQFGSFLYARRRLYNQDWTTSWIGLDRLMNDKSSLFNKKAKDVWDKPAYWNELPDEIWEKVRKTKLWEVMMRFDEYKQASKIWDEFHRLQGKMVNETRKTVDNQFIEPDEFYIWFKAKRGPRAEITAELGSDDFYNTYISPSALKKVTKEIQNSEYVWDYNPISSMYGPWKQARYYAFMQKAHKDMIAVYDGRGKGFKNLSIDELNEFMDKPESYSFRKSGKNIEIDGEQVNAWTSKISAIVEDIVPDGNGWTKSVFNKEIIDVSDIEVKGKWVWVKDSLSDAARYRMSKYIERVWKGWSVIDSQLEKMLAQMANHFNRLPLMGSASVILKQPLSLIDAQWLIGPKHLIQAEKDLIWEWVFSKNWISKALDNIPSINNRWGWDYLIRELIKPNTPKNAFEKMSKAYGSYVELAMSPIKYADQWTYKKIWLAAYRRNLVDRGLIDSGQRLDASFIKAVDEEAMSYADDIANRSASTANPLLMPQVYDRAWSKAMFGIFTTQLNRLQIAFKDAPNMWKDGNKQEALYLYASLMTANVAEYAVTVAVGKWAYALWATTWEWYWESFKDQMLTKDMVIRSTIWQTFGWSKLEGINNPNFWMAPIFWGLNKTNKNFRKMLEDPNFETITEFPVELFLGKIGEQIHTATLK